MAMARKISSFRPIGCCSKDFLSKSKGFGQTRPSQGEDGGFADGRVD